MISNTKASWRPVAAWSTLRGFNLSVNNPKVMDGVHSQQFYTWYWISSVWCGRAATVWQASWQRGTSWSSAKGHAKPCTWRRTTPCASTDWAEASWRGRSSAEKHPGVLARELSTSQHCALTAKETNSSLDCNGISVVSRSAEVILPLSAGGAAPEGPCTVLGSLVWEGHGYPGARPAKGLGDH